MVLVWRVCCIYCTLWGEQIKLIFLVKIFAVWVVRLVSTDNLVELY